MGNMRVIFDEVNIDDWIVFMDLKRKTLCHIKLVLFLLLLFIGIVRVEYFCDIANFWHNNFPQTFHCFHCFHVAVYSISLQFFFLYF